MAGFSVDMSSILKTVSSYVNSAEGQKAIFSGPGGAGAIDISERKKEMSLAGREMAALLNKHAASAGLPATVMQHVESFRPGIPTVNKNGSGSVIVRMTDDASRQSLQPQRYGGVQDIVMLFNDGYDAANQIRGRWISSTGEDRGVVKSLQSRPGLFFIQAAIDEFNATYGARYNVTATLG